MALVERDLAPMRLRRDQKEILKLHTLGRRARRKPDTLALPEHEGYCISQLHACKMNANARPRTSTKGVESSLGSWG